MKILSLEHVQIAMPAGEEEKARAFFVGLLGFYEIQKPAELAARGGVWFQSENVKIHLGIELDFQPARKAHPAFLVDNLDGFISKIKSSGFKIDDSQPPLQGYKRVHIFDPFGNRIELMQRAEPWK